MGSNIVTALWVGLALMQPGETMEPVPAETAVPAENVPSDASTEPAPDFDYSIGETEEERAARYINFLAPPETPAAPIMPFDVAADELSVVAVALYVNDVEAGITACRDLREKIEAEIGNRPGSYSVRPAWISYYQSCLKHRSAEMQMATDALKALEAQQLAAASDEAASDRWALMARLGTRMSSVKTSLSREYRAQKALVTYYNTGERPGAPAAPADDS